MKRHSMWIFALMMSAVCLLGAPQISAAAAQGGNELSDFRGVVATLPLDVQRPLPQQLAELTPPDGVAGDVFGSAVAISGNTLVVGAPGQGAAYVFVKPASGWANMSPTAALTASDGSAGLGTAVAIDGKTIVVARGNSAGMSVYVYVEPSTGWTNMTETAELTTPSHGTGGARGPAVATNGHAVFVGVPGENLNREEFVGEVVVFVEPPGGWVSTSQYSAKLTASDSSEDASFGSSLSLSGDTLAVAKGWYGGPIYIFVKPTGGWKGTLTETARLSTTTGDILSTVAISGNTVAAGSPSGPFAGGAEPGAVYMFVEPATGWTDMTETAELTASDPGPFDELGASVAINATGTIVAAGVPGRSSWTGVAYLFDRPAAGWNNMHQNVVLAASDGQPGNVFGQSIGIGGVILVGALQAGTDYFSGPGAAYLYGP